MKKLIDWKSWTFWEMVAILSMLQIVAIGISVWGFICYYQWLK